MKKLNYNDIYRVIFFFTGTPPKSSKYNKLASSKMRKLKLTRLKLTSLKVDELTNCQVSSLQ